MRLRHEDLSRYGVPSNVHVQVLLSPHPHRPTRGTAALARRKGGHSQLFAPNRFLPCAATCFHLFLPTRARPIAGCYAALLLHALHQFFHLTCAAALPGSRHQHCPSSPSSSSGPFIQPVVCLCWPSRHVDLIPIHHLVAPVPITITITTTTQSYASFATATDCSTLPARKMFNPSVAEGGPATATRSRRRQRPKSSDSLVQQPKAKRQRLPLTEQTFVKPDVQPEMVEAAKADKIATLDARQEVPPENFHHTSRKELNVRAKKSKHGDRAANKGDGSLVLVNSTPPMLDLLSGLEDCYFAPNADVANP